MKSRFSLERETVKEKPVKKKAASKKRVLSRKPEPKPEPIKALTEHIRLVSGENKGEFLEELNRAIDEGWEVINVFVKHYDYVAALKK